MNGDSDMREDRQATRRELPPVYPNEDDAIDMPDAETGSRAKEALWALAMAFVGVDEDKPRTLIAFAREFRRIQTQYVNGRPITVGGT